MVFLQYRRPRYGAVGRRGNRCMRSAVPSARPWLDSFLNIAARWDCSSCSSLLGANPDAGRLFWGNFRVGGDSTQDAMLVSASTTWCQFDANF